MEDTHAGYAGRTSSEHTVSFAPEALDNLRNLVTAKEKITNNDKYAFRCFLLRLWFIGAEFKDERKILLRNLSGNSAFKSGAKHTAEAMADAMPIEQVNASFGGENDAVSA